MTQHGAKGPENKEKNATENQADQNGAGCAHPFSVRRIATEIREGLIVLTLGVWCAVLGGEGPTSKIADAIEGWLIGRGRTTPRGPRLFQLELDASAGIVIVLLNEDEGACVVEELHRALGDLERFEADGDERARVVAVPPPRDTEPHPEPAPAPSVFPGFSHAVGEVCS